MSPTAQLGSHLQKAYCKILRMGLAAGRSPKKTGDTSANTMPAAVIAALYIAYFRRTYNKSADALQSTRLEKKEEAQWIR